VDVPENLGELVAKRIEGTPLSWEEGLALVVTGVDGLARQLAEAGD
jgi:hypothetical protein